MINYCIELPVLSDDVPLVVSRQLLQTFAQELGKLEPENQKEIAHYTLRQIQPRVVSFEEQVSVIHIHTTLPCITLNFKVSRVRVRFQPVATVLSKLS